MKALKIMKILKKMNAIKKIVLPLFFSLLAAAPVFSQNSDSEILPAPEAKGISVRPYFNIGTNITLNLASKEKIAPTPVNFTFGGGVVLDITDLISIEPRLDFWMMYYLYDGIDALPAEVEHRTATTLCFMLDCPVGFNFRFGKHTITPGAGLGFLMRFGLLSTGVKDNDKGATGTAKGDIEKINSWFWGNARFLYPEIFLSWDYKVNDNFRAGLTAKVYLPVGQLISGNGVDGMIINVTSRFVF